MGHCLYRPSRPFSGLENHPTLAWSPKVLELRRAVSGSNFHKRGNRLRAGPRLIVCLGTHRRKNLSQSRGMSTFWMCFLDVNLVFCQLRMFPRNSIKESIGLKRAFCSRMLAICEMLLGLHVGSAGYLGNAMWVARRRPESHAGRRVFLWLTILVDWVRHRQLHSGCTTESHRPTPWD